ncbi:MAG: class I SAM-dependent methyltransferase [Chloroflexota bacterium]|nr:class I SAM-dependent methyltransferase [Chloroflexota bacterium]
MSQSYQAKPETIEGDWDRFYLEFPEVYDRFALHDVAGVAEFAKRFDLSNKIIVDVASGTGLSTFELARHARFVVGVEPWATMRDFAVKKARLLRVQNVAFLAGVAHELPFGENVADFVVSVFGFPFGYWQEGRRDLAAHFITESQRIVRPGGYIISINGPPLFASHAWSAGAESPHLEWQPKPDQAGMMAEQPAEEQVGFDGCEEIMVNADYGTVQEAVETYGFIYGHKAIDWLIAGNLSSVPWKLRIYSIKVD